MSVFRNHRTRKVHFSFGLRVTCLMIVAFLFGGPLGIHALASACCMKGCDQCPHCSMTKAPISAENTPTHQFLSADRPAPGCCADESQPTCRMETGWDLNHMEPYTLSTREGHPYLSLPPLGAANESVSNHLLSGFRPIYAEGPLPQFTHLYLLTQTFLI